MMFGWRCFPLLGLKQRFLGVGGGVFLIHRVVQVQAISGKSLSPGWALAVNLLPRHHCWITAWESDPPE